jgi:hypothetical protein
MRRQNCTFLFVLAVLFFGMLSAPVYAGEEKLAEKQAATQQDDWEFALSFYVWMPDIETTTASGHEVEITFSDILDNLGMTLMTSFGARKDKWTFMTDVVYLYLDYSDNINIGSLLKVTDLYMKNVIVSPVASYEIMGGEKGSLQLLAGARFLWIELGLDLETLPPLPSKKTDDDADGDVWDGIVGVRGRLNLTDRWFMPYRFDVGTGDSDKTWQAMGGFGYRFDKVKVLAIYRYMKWDFGNDSPMDDLKVYGPMVGAIYTF